MVAIGGLLTVKRVAFWYKPLLDKDTSTDVPAKERFIAPPDRGIGEPEELQKKMTEALEGMHDRLDRRKMFLVGHSLGGLIATVAALEHPELISGVVSLGGAHSGYSKETPATLALRHMLGNPAEARHLKHDSPFMQEHQEKMANEWPSDVPLHIISSPNDVLVVTPHGFDVELPGEQEADKRIVIPPSPFGLIEKGTRRILGISNNVKSISSKRPTEHVNLPRVPAVTNYINESRLALSGLGSVVEAPSFLPEALPAVA